VAIQQHYRKLRNKVRQTGLWNWARVASAFHLARIPLHTGTIAVERLWAQLKSIMPEGARRISEEWFQFMSSLLFLRVNYNHFHSKALPSWTDNDPLLAQRLDSMIAVAEALATDAGVFAEIPVDVTEGDTTFDVEVEEVEQMFAPVGDQALEGAGPIPPNSVHMRVLKQTWAEALANGLKWVETQRYNSKWSNMMKFAEQDNWLVFGTSGQVYGIAVLGGTSITKLSDLKSSGILDSVDDTLHEQLIEYLQPAQTFDYVQVSRVYDLRASELTWHQLWKLPEAREPGNKQGFKRIGGLELASRLFSMVRAHGAIRTPYDSNL
jgi:hypothetical protein